MNTTTTRAAILAGAQLIEDHPEIYDYNSQRVGDKVCMIGAIGKAAGMPTDSSLGVVIYKIL